MREYATRLHETDIVRLERVIDAIEKNSDGVRPKNATFIRTLIEKGLDQWEKKFKLKKLSTRELQQIVDERARQREKKS
jgi:hypothetical protein